MKVKTSKVLNTGILMLALVVLVTQSGCGGRATHPKALSEVEQQRLGVVAVISANFPVSPVLVKPAAGTREGLGRGMAGGAAVGAYLLGGGGYCAHPLCIVTALAGAVAGGLVGAVAGGATALDEKQVQCAEAVLRRSMDEMTVGQDFTEALISEIRQHSSLVLAPCDMSGPSVPDERVDYQALREKGIDTVIEAGVAGFGLSGPELAVDPPVAVKVSARVRLVRVENNSLVYEETFSYTGQSRRFLEWARDDGRSFREETGMACRRLAAMIVEKLSPAVVSPDPVADGQK